MKTEYVMGNSAIALGAMCAGVNMVCGYPGTPSSEIIETIYKFKVPGLHLEWSVNEKSAMEVAAAGAYAGARTLVTMKQVGLNVASDPLMSLAYVGVKGGMVIVSADDPGPISSQTEQDTRRFGDFARLPVFDPSTPDEAFTMIQEAFEYSEKYNTPVLFRPVTRVCHAYTAITFDENFKPKNYEGFVKDSKKWVIFPRLSFANHKMMEERLPVIGKDFSGNKANLCEGNGTKAVFACGVSWAYAKESIGDFKDVKLVKIGTPFPFPVDFVKDALKGVDEVLVLEELSPYVEEALLKLCGQEKLSVKIYGKLTGNAPHSGELSADSARSLIKKFVTGEADCGCGAAGDLPELPVRPPVLCAGCPHRASFYAVKQAMKGKKAFFCGDIGCYTLGNAMPLDMCDTCLCMGAGITMAQGFYHMEKDAACFSFTGDSTFFASGMTGVANAIFNEANMTLCILDNSTTAMTGHQPHPGTGKNMMGNIVEKISIENVLHGLGVKEVRRVNPFELNKAIETVKEVSAMEGVKAILFEAPCIALYKCETKMAVTQDKCIGCKKCIREIGCPAISFENGKAVIDMNLCYGCNLCAQICPVDAINFIGK
ncbi:MAG: indolepyruvate ferredoxin oxidoreductase subunit alpha [Treponema sp.]|nr:indolepyruvate ferredoxin oxidoreductase subunit alpha [Treponema sp.]